MESILLYTSFPRKTTAPSAVTIAKERKIAYYLKDDYIPEIAVFESHSAWWMNSRKLHKIVNALKEGHLIKDALYKAQVSKGEWEYFNKQHPEFSGVIEACKSYQRFPAMSSVNRALPKDPKLAFAWLKARHPDFQTQKVDEDLPQQPKVPIAAPTQVNVGVVINNDEGKIQTVFREIASPVYADRERKGGDTGQAH